MRGEHRHCIAHTFDNGRANEDTREVAVVEGRHRYRRLERGELTSVAVSANRDINGVEGPLPGPRITDLVGQQDHAGARAENGQVSGQSFGQRLTQTVDIEQLGDRGRLATRNDQTIDLVEVLCGTNLDRTGAGGLER